MSWIYENFRRIADKRPLVHHITNWVTIYDCANITRSFGALPVMAYAKEEVAEMTSAASALVLNIGTLDSEKIESMIIAGKSANKKGIPVILDAVGVGATKFRNDKASELLESIRISIVKGNAGEIGSLAGVKAEVRGVESISVAKEPKVIVRDLAKRLSSIVVITGKVDFVSNGKTTYAISNGHEMMGRVVGTGCMATSVLGCFASVEKDYLKSSAAALSCYGIVGELAADGCEGMGTFKTRFFDSIGRLTEKVVDSRAQVKEIPT